MRGDEGCRNCYAERTAFQSAPRTFMRGDRLPLRIKTWGWGFNPHPALSCGVTSTTGYVNSLYVVSIRTPHFHAG